MAPPSTSDPAHYPNPLQLKDWVLLSFLQIPYTTPSCWLPAPLALLLVHALSWPLIHGSSLGLLPFIKGPPANLIMANMALEALPFFPIPTEASHQDLYSHLVTFS